MIGALGALAGAGGGLPGMSDSGSAFSEASSSGSVGGIHFGPSGQGAAGSGVTLQQWAFLALAVGALIYVAKGRK